MLVQASLQTRPAGQPIARARCLATAMFVPLLPHRDAQAGDVRYRLHWQVGEEAWDVQGPLPVEEHGAYRLQVEAPTALLLPFASPPCGADSQQQHQPPPQPQPQPPHQRQLQQREEGGGQGCQEKCPALPVRICLRTPDGCPSAIRGWSDCKVPAAAATAPSAAATFTQCSGALSVLACVRGRYLPTEVVACEAPEQSSAEGEWDDLSGLDGSMASDAPGPGQQYTVRALA